MTGKGCSHRKRNKFLKFLTNLFKNEIQEESDLREINDSQLIFELKFKKLDQNDNRKLEEKEWSGLKKRIMSAVKGYQMFKKCAKMFANVECDLNGDSEVDQSEWFSCTSRQNRTKWGPVNGSNNQSKRRGPNPFSTILKAD